MDGLLNHPEASYDEISFLSNASVLFTVNLQAGAKPLNGGFSRDHRIVYAKAASTQDNSFETCLWTLH